MKPTWDRVREYAHANGMTTWLGVDPDSGEVVAQVNEAGGIVWEGRGATSNAAIQHVLGEIEIPEEDARP